MKKFNQMRVKAVILAAIIFSTGIMNGIYGHAEEIVVEETSSEAETVLEEEISETDIMSEEIGTEFMNGDLKENSFRYENGEWIHDEISPYADGFIPWSFTDGHWINSLGDPIPGALEKGIDVSFAQGRIDWEKVADTDVSYAIIRCGYGNDQEDQDDVAWKYNADECTRLGIPFGVYIYSYALTTEAARSEAEHVLRLVDGYDLAFPIYLDLEDERFTGRLSNKEIADIAEVFCETIQSAGYDVGIYANLDWFRNRLTDWRFAQWPKWVAQYNTECNYDGEYTMWQCTSLGSVDGIDAFVDLNFTMDITATEPDFPEKKVADFVGRLYELVLDRKPDEAGLEAWTRILLSKEETGAQVARGFIMSDELYKRNLTDEEYITILYKTFLDRNPDENGKKEWIQCLTQGLSREHVFKGFAESIEFGDICASYDIIRGNVVLTNIMDLYPNITKFVYRNYTQFLGRKPDKTGHLDWVTRLAQKSRSPEEVAYGFVFSNELKDKHLSDTEYVKVLYRGLFDREADLKGLESWVALLRKNVSREEVFEGFANSDEFHRMVEGFGL